MLSFIPHARWVIGHFPVPKALTFKMSPGAQPFL